jgi:hypothetical protein
MEVEKCALCNSDASPYEVNGKWIIYCNNVSCVNAQKQHREPIEAHWNDHQRMIRAEARLVQIAAACERYKIARATLREGKFIDEHNAKIAQLEAKLKEAVSRALEYKVFLDGLASVKVCKPCLDVIKEYCEEYAKTRAALEGK